MILFLKEKQKIVVAVVVVIGVVLGASWFFLHSIGSFEELSRGIYSADEYTDLGKRFEVAGQWKDAEKAYLEAIKLDPALQLRAYLALDEIYQKKFRDKAGDIERIYFRGISQNPQSRALIRGLAQYYERVKDYTRAYQWYSMVVQYYPEDSDSRNAMIRAREKLNTE